MLSVVRSLLPKPFYPAPCEETETPDAASQARSVYSTDLIPGPLLFAGSLYTWSILCKNLERIRMLAIGSCFL